MTQLSCWKCGESLASLSLPLLRDEACRACGADLHVCRFCVFYDTSVAKSCREPIADEVRDKERANFCGYLTPNPSAYAPADPQAAQSRNELASLFGDMQEPDDTNAKDAARKKLDDLFGGN